MKDFIENLTVKRIIVAVTAVVSLIIFFVLLGISSWMKQSLESQNMASRWSGEGGVGQISCFFSQESVTKDLLVGFEHTLDQALIEASITSESTNTNARLWADAYSVFGKLTIKSDNGSIELDALGVGGDYFLFHPLQLLNGSFFSEDDLMQDRIVIDEDAAWQLFGSNDIVGKQVMIEGIPHYVNGVIKRDTGRLNEKSGNGASVAYVSYDTMSKIAEKQGKELFINHYELVMPNPVTDFAFNMVKEKIGIDETKMDIVENSARFNLIPLFKVIGEFGTRSMNGKAIIFPYWENVARGYEDIMALILMIQIVLLLYPFIILIIFIVYLWRHRRWHFNDIKEFAIRKQEQWYQKRLNKKSSKEQEEPDL